MMPPMPHDRIDVGHIELIALLDCDGEISAMAESFPDFPSAELLAYRERYPGVYGATGGWQLKVRGWLIRHPGGVILVDTGIGVRGAPGPTWFGAPGRLMDSLHETGTPADAIDTVVISHVHDDHIGGTVVFAPAEPGGDLVPAPAFPNARHLLQRADWDWEREAAERDEEDALIVSTLLTPIEDAGLLDLIEGDRRAGRRHHAPPRARDTRRATRWCGCARRAGERSSRPTPSTTRPSSHTPTGRAVRTRSTRRPRRRDAR